MKGVTVTSETPPLSQTREMRLRKVKGRIPGHDNWRKHSGYGPSQSPSGYRMASTCLQEGHPSIPWIHQFLSAIHQGLCQNG